MIDTRFILKMCVDNYAWIVITAIQIGVAYILGKKLN